MRIHITHKKQSYKIEDATLIMKCIAPAYTYHIQKAFLFSVWRLSILYRSYIFHSCIFHPCDLLLHFPLLHFPPLLSTPAFSTPAFSAPPPSLGSTSRRYTAVHALKIKAIVTTIFNKKLIRRWDSERELSLRRQRARDTKYNRLVHKFRHSSTRRLCVGTYVYQIQWNNAT